MGDRYASFANSGPGHAVVKRLGLPDPPRLRRDAAAEGPVLLGAAPGGRLIEAVRKVLTGVDVLDTADP
ncbi:short chain dehydrogenase, partial [Actinoplanes sp. NPDC051633]